MASRRRGQFNAFLMANAEREKVVPPLPPGLSQDDITCLFIIIVVLHKRFSVLHGAFNLKCQHQYYHFYTLPLAIRGNRQ